jgi:adenosylcobinamide-GDP ribazoletransferase
VTGRDIALIRGADFGLALGLLTRLPVPVDPAQASQRGAAAAWAWPLAGLVVALIAALMAFAGQAVGLGAGEVAALALGTQAMVTGAMHEDGLADTADGFWGGWTMPARLEIMKDSHIGTYGVLAVAITLLARWSALVSLIEANAYWAALLAAGLLSRAPMVAMMAALPNARGTGLSSTVGRPGAGTTLLALGIASAGGMALLGAQGLLALLGLAAATLALGTLAKVKVGGQTGDVLGASQQIGETLLLAFAAATLA